MTLEPLSLAVIPDTIGSVEAFHAATSPWTTLGTVGAVAVSATEKILEPSAVRAVMMNVSPVSTKPGVKTVCRRIAWVLSAPPLLALAPTVKGK